MDDFDPYPGEFGILSLFRISLVPREPKAPDAFPERRVGPLPRDTGRGQRLTILIGLAAIPVQRVKRNMNDLGLDLAQVLTRSSRSGPVNRFGSSEDH